MSTSCISWPRGCWNSRPSRSTRSGASSAAKRSSATPAARSSRRPPPRPRPDAAPRCRPPAAARPPASSRSRSRAVEPAFRGTVFLKSAKTRSLFGTDGIRGIANAEPMTAETALQVAMAAGLILKRGDHRHLAVIGKDTRLSGYLIEPALTSGFIAMGMDVVLVGPMPTPAIAMLTRSLRADLGVMISASHNPFEDNGIKLFGPDGYKLSDEIEQQIEAQIERAGKERAPSSGLGRARRLDDAGGRYIEFVKSSFPRGLRLDGLKVVVDCAHGAAYRVAPTVLWELGAEVVPLGVAPDGLNINRDCGTMGIAAT